MTSRKGPGNIPGQNSSKLESTQANCTLITHLQEADQRRNWSSHPRAQGGGPHRPRDRPRPRHLRRRARQVVRRQRREVWQPWGEAHHRVSEIIALCQYEAQMKPKRAMNSVGLEMTRVMF